MYKYFLCSKQLVVNYEALPLFLLKTRAESNAFEVVSGDQVLMLGERIQGPRWTTSTKTQGLLKRKYTVEECVGELLWAWERGSQGERKREWKRELL